MRKLRLFDPRTGHRIDSDTHRALLRYAVRKIKHYDSVADEAHQHMERMRRRSAQVKWARQVDRALSRLEYWREFKERLEDQLKRRVEYEAKFAYTGKRKENNRDRANLNIRMRFYGRPPLPTDREVKSAFYNLLLNGKPPKGWEYAVCDWRNDRLADRGWRRGTWRGGNTQPDTVGRGPWASQRRDPGVLLDWASNMVVHSTLEDFDTLVIGEVEE